MRLKCIGRWGFMGVEGAGCMGGAGCHVRQWHVSAGLGEVSGPTSPIDRITSVPSAQKLAQKLRDSFHGLPIGLTAFSESRT